MKLNQIPGLNTANDPYDVGFEGLVRAENVDLSRNGSASRRAGRTRVYAGVIQAAWSDSQAFLFVEGGELKQLNPDYTATVLESGLVPPTVLWAERSTLGNIYWTTGYDSGVLVNGVNRSLGLPKPPAPIITQSTGGELPSGRYLVALAYVTASGEHGPLSEVTIFSGQYGIVIGAVPSTAALIRAQVTGITLYLTTQNGEVLYEAGTFSLDTAGSYIGNATDLTAPADGLYREPLPTGEHIVEFAGRLWTARDGMLLYTDLYSEMTDLRENFIPVGGPITNVGAVTDGLFVTTDSMTYYLLGRDPREMGMEEKAQYGGVANTMIRVDGRAIGGGADSMGLLWASTQGVCAGLSGGSLSNLTERRVNNLSGVRGSAYFRETNGQQHYVAALQTN